ncbi:hypothetical protein ASPZODRAFT_128155 [Penicilliopsis zonata CBS 506.65]|uniref:C2H2-type domain-containing protein n=1 Tax=Penicilliopsis zonata CBS 506.65 TaxID=1073090 RepID=A0A1L9SR08_9EURO|nr:hypothetical protein ASPZODRAFT_128155 [Penicilliopsis zonata CBS 506.65]OJJ49662.1 hypothetical protein ASPZODRAFT_128155 [Penicilliopsis zonata CBS 506.65]
MSGCKTSIVSILNNDDHPSFAVRSTSMLSKQPSLYGQQQQQQQQHHHQYHHQQQQQQQQTHHHHHHHHHHQQQRYQHRPDYYSYAESNRLPRLYESIPSSETTQPLSPGSSDCSHDYRPSGYAPYHHHHAFPYLPPVITSSSSPVSTLASSFPDRRYGLPSPPDPPSPQASLVSTTSTGNTTHHNSNSNGSSSSSANQDLASRGTRKNKYPCPYAASHGCSATFTTSGHAARHGKKHTGEKSVHCPICNKAFTRKDNMKQHIRTHRTHPDEVALGIKRSPGRSPY